MGQNRQTIVLAAIDATGAKRTTSFGKIDYRETRFIVFNNMLGTTAQAGIALSAMFDKLCRGYGPGRVTLVGITRQFTF